MIRVGFIGFGRFAQTRKEILTDSDDVVVVGYYDPSSADLYDRDGICSYSSADDLVKCVDAIIVSVPPKLARVCDIRFINKNMYFVRSPQPLILRH